MAFAPSVLRPEARGVAPRAGVATRPGLRAPLTARAARMAFAPSVLRPEARGVAPRGVDLNLNEFDLSDATATDRKVGVSWQEADANVVIGDSFWAAIDGELPVFSEEDAELLRSVFNAKMSDRREEGASFVPPDSSAAYVEKLRELVEAEDKVRLDRVEKFLSPEFKRGEYDALFPPSWASVRIRDAQAKAELHERIDYLVEADELSNIVQSLAASFEKSTEDGAIFRIYEKGTLEVRTVQEHECEEVVGVVYSKRA